MKITGDMEINAVIEIDEQKMLNTLAWLAPELGRLQCPHPMREVIGGVTVEQAARITGIELSEMLYALNLAAGEAEEGLLELRDHELRNIGSA